MPAGKGLNVYADIDHFSFQKLEDATKLLKPGYFISKVDIRHAYRSIPIHRDNYRATGLKWRCKGTNTLPISLTLGSPLGGGGPLAFFIIFPKPSSG